MKVFSPILAPLAKMMDTGWGKALMIALSIFTMGSAFVAAQAVYQGAIAAGQSMLSAFVQGGVEFVKVFLGAEASGAQVSAGAGTAVGSTGVTNAEAFMGAGEAVQGLDAANKIAETGAATIKGAGELVAGAGSGAATGAGVGSGAAAGAGNTAKVAGAATQAGPTQALADAGGKLATETSGNWLTKAANDAWDWAKKDDFKNTKDLISGYSEYEDREDVQRHQDRYSRRWRKDTEGLEALSQIGTGDQPRFSPGGPGQTLDRNRRGFQPTIPYRGKGQPQGAGG